MTKTARRTAGVLNDKQVKECYKVMRAVSGPLRYKIVCLLSASPKGMTVTTLAESLGSSLSRVSHQLRILRQGNMVKNTRRNREVVYALETSRLQRHLLIRCL